MTTDRCPACSAAVTPGAPWCTLCYADLRPKPVASVEPVTAPAAEPVTAPAADNLLLPAPSAPAVALADAPSWPCRSCGARNALADDACTQCATPFLEPDAGVSLNLPVVGDVARLEKGQRIGLMIGGMVAITALLMVVAFLLGSVL